MPVGYTPIYKIVKDGLDLTSKFNDRATSITVQLKDGGGDADTCQISIDDRDWKIATVQPGARLEVFLGYKEVGLAQMGVFEIDSVDYNVVPKSIDIVGNSIGFTTPAKQPTVKNHDKPTLGDLVRGIAKSHGATAAVSDALDGIQLPFVNQSSSDLQMLVELERRFGAVATFNNGRLVFQERDSGKAVDGSDLPKWLLKPWDIHKAKATHTKRSEYSGAKVGWIDQDHVKHYVEHANPAAPQGVDNPFLSNMLGRNENEAKTIARSQMGQLLRSEGQLYATLAKGNPWIRPQMPILMAGFRPEVNGSYIAETVTHTFVSEPGLGTDLTARPPGEGQTYDSLDEKTFYSLGSNGLTVPSGAPPAGTASPATPETKGDSSTSPVQIDTTTVTAV
jgi:phage protein D